VRRHRPACRVPRSAAAPCWLPCGTPSAFAAYWQQPDAGEQVFTDEAARAALRPVAEAVVAAVGATDVRWWTAPANRGCQRYAHFLDEHPLPEPLLTGAAESTDAWLADTLDDEQSAHDRPADPAAHIPAGGGQVRRYPGRCTRLRDRRPDQWAELVGRYPLDVSRSRRHDWWRAAEWAGRDLVDH
jgi:hypothetical protein